MRLLRGDFGEERVYADDPVEVAERWAALGAPRLHVVDLDGARSGSPVHLDLIARICRSVPVPVEVSGGLRSLSDIEWALALGADRVQLGSVAVHDPALAAAALERWPERIVIAVDGRSGRAATEGWGRLTDRTLEEVARAMVELGARRLMVTDIDRDGTLEGPNVELYERLCATLPVPVIASGGVRSIEDLRRLAAAGCEGAIVGRALYEGTIDLREALEAVGRC